MTTMPTNDRLPSGFCDSIPGYSDHGMRHIFFCCPYRADRITTVGRCAPSISLDGGDDDWTTGYVYTELPLGSDGVNRCDWDTFNYDSQVGPFGAVTTREVCNPSVALFPKG
jgi:hypothetical protein